jgi:hypothetical protein
MMLWLGLLILGMCFGVLIYSAYRYDQLEKRVTALEGTKPKGKIIIHVGEITNK